MLAIGKIIGTRGLKGEVKIYPYTNHAEDFERIKKVYIDEEGITQLNIEKIKENKNILFVKFEEINHIDKSDELKNTEIFIDAEGEHDFLSDDSYFYKDLIEFEIIDENKKVYGKVKSVQTGNHQDYFIIKNKNGEWYLPNVKEFIKDINFEEKIIIAHIIEGMTNED